MSRSPLQNKLNEIIFGTETPAGKTFDIVLMVAIALSVLAVMLDSVNMFSERYERLLLIIEWFFTALFTLEFIVRLYCAPHPFRYAKSFYGIIDLLSILPAYLSIIYAGTQYFLVIRLLRILRVFRILKLLRISESLQIL